MTAAPTAREHEVERDQESSPGIDLDPATHSEPRDATRAATVPPRSERVAPLRHPSRWIATAVVLVILAQVVHGLVTNPFFQWPRFAYWFTRPVILEGLLVTLKVAAISAVLGLLGGVVLALMRLSSNPVLQAVSWTYIWLFRSIPLIVLLLIMYNFGALYETLSLGIPFGPAFVEFNQSELFTDLMIAVIAISLHEAAFAAEIVRGGILSVDPGQHEASAALGLPRRYQFLKITLPRALRSIVPNYVNLLVGLIMGTSLVFYVSLLDLFGTVQTMGATFSGDIIPLLLVATAWYVILTSLLSIAQYYLERHYGRGAVRTLPLTPLQRLRTQLRRVSQRAEARA